MSRKADRYGIDMRRWCAAHEQRVEEALSQGTVSPALLERHREKLSWLQHERQVHLIVVALTSLAELFAVDLALLHPEVSFGAALVMLVLAVLLGFYFAHYFFLENTTQHWYRLTEELLEALSSDKA